MQQVALVALLFHANASDSQRQHHDMANSGHNKSLCRPDHNVSPKALSLFCSLMRMRPWFMFNGSENSLSIGDILQWQLQGTHIGAPGKSPAS